MIVPEWANPSAIALVWPEHLPSGVGSRIKSFYRDFIRLLLREDISILLLYCESLDLPKLKNLFSQDNITFHYEPKVADIWIRDFGPLFFEDNGKLRPIKTLYQPSYAYSAEEVNWFGRNNKVGFELTKQVPDKVELNGDELILDGGNLIHNGCGTGIVTNRVFSDNEHLFEHEIRSVFREKLGIDELHIIPSEPGDNTGHIDGMVRFLDPNTLAILEYPGNYTADPKYINKQDYTESVKATQKIAVYLANQNFNIVRIPCSIPLKGKHKMPSKLYIDNTFENAAGNYMNFLRAGNKIFLPQYNNPVEDENAFKVINEYFEKFHPEVKVIVVPSDATPLSEYGGIINCISLQLFGNKVLDYDPFKPFVVVAEEKGEVSTRRIYIAAKQEILKSVEEYIDEPVIGIDLEDKSVFPPNKLKYITKHRSYADITFASPNARQHLKKLLSFHPENIRKLWLLFELKIDGMFL
jgi:agmatine deiminase